MGVVPHMSAQADIWGGDVAVLMQILQENIRHYYQLQEMIGQGRESANYLKWINQGIDNSIGLLNSLPVKDERVLAELREFQGALKKIQGVYGSVPTSPMGEIQSLQDQIVAESLRMVGDFKDFSSRQEKNSEVIASQARDASPKGAARMQAETSAQILRSLSQLIRLNTQILKLQSERMAFDNKQSKDGVANFQKVNRDFGRGFSKFNPDMKLVRF